MEKDQAAVTRHNAASGEGGPYRGRREGSEADGQDPVGPLVGHQVKLSVQLAHGDRLRVQDRYLDLVLFHKSLREREEPTLFALRDVFSPHGKRDCVYQNILGSPRRCC